MLQDGTLTKRLRMLRFFAVVFFLLAIPVTIFLVKFPTHLFEFAATAPTSLPAFGLGVAQGQNQTWAQNSGVPWSYAYQYFTGGVNTGGGWETWNTNGTFASNWANEIGGYGYIPFISYYEMIPSSGSCDSCGEAQKDLSNLNNTSTMLAYYNNFTLLMKRLGTGTYDGVTGYGKLAVVQIEPDLSGNAMQAVNNISSCYTYCTGVGNDPSLLKSVVASSGDPDLSAKDSNGNPIYPDTYQGFNWALLHIRDLYAPNVLLAFHISNWATGDDIGQDHSTTTNVAALGQEAGQFASASGTFTVPSGVSTYNMLTSDLLDRDAGYYKAVYGNPNVWWDRLNATFPNFQRYESYIGAAHQVTNKPLILWQIPVGNQYFDTENDTTNHYQDNRVEYFLGQNLDFSTNHLQEFKNVGVIALLFGAGAGGQSSYTDQQPDGITNPASFCTTDGISSGQICNNHISSYADDDGGYLRLMAAQFYNVTLPTPTPGPTDTPTPTAGPPASQPLILYDGSKTTLNVGGGDASYTIPPTIVNWSNTSPTYNGDTYSVKTFIPSYNAFSFALNPNIIDGGYGALDFWVLSDGPGSAFNVQTDTTIGTQHPQVGASAYILGGDDSFMPNKWEQVSIPFSALGIVNQTVTRFYFIGLAGNTPPNYYFDNISLTPRNDNPTPTPTPPSSNFVFYDSQSGSPANGFVDHSFTSPGESTIYNNTSPIHSGNYSVKAIIPEFNAFELDGSVSTVGYKALDYWIQAGGSGTGFWNELVNGKTVTPEQYIQGGDTSFVIGKWEHVVVPLSALQACNTTVTAMSFVGSTNASSSPSPLYIDTVSMDVGQDPNCPTAPTISPTGTGPTPTIQPTPTSTVAPGTPTPTTTQTAGQWQNISPAGVSTNFADFGSQNYGFLTIVTNPQNPTTVYVGTCYQGIYKSTNSGTSWNRVDTSGGSVTMDGRIMCLAIDPFNTNTMYGCNGFSGTAQGVMKSTDGGVTWNQVLPQSISTITGNDIYDVATDPYQAGHLLVAFHGWWGTSSNTGVLESSDSGATWTIHYPPSGDTFGTGNYIFFMDNSHTWLLTTQSGGFWKTTDSGATWTQVESTYSMEHGGEQLYHDKVNNTWYTGVWQYLLRSTDDGQSWTPVLGANGQTLHSQDGINGIIGDGTNIYTMFANTGSATDGPYSYLTSPETDGTIWNQQNSQQFSDGPMSMAYDPVNHIVYSSNWDGGVWRLQTSGNPLPTLTPTPTSLVPTPTATPVPPTHTSTPLPPTLTPTPVVPTPTFLPNTLGDTNVGPITDNGDNNTLDGSQITTGVSGFSVTSASIYVTSVASSPTNTSYQIGIYTNVSGKPRSLVAQSQVGTLAAAGGWQTIPLTASLSPNTSYWLMYNSNGTANTNILSYTTGPANIGADFAGTVAFGSMPASFGSANLGPWEYALYVSTGEAGTPTVLPPTPTLTPTPTPSPTVAPSPTLAPSLSPTLSGIPHLLGDITGPTPGVPDGLVCYDDIGMLANPANWLHAPGNPPLNPQADFTGPTPGVPDGLVNLLDLSAMAKNFSGAAACVGH